MQSRQRVLDIGLSVLIGVVLVGLLAQRIGTRTVRAGDIVVARQGMSGSLGDSIVPSNVLVRWQQSGYRIGPAHAPVQIVVFGNLTCGFCGQLYFALDSLSKELPGMFAVTWMSFVPPASTGIMSARGYSLALECAGSLGRFEPFIDTVFRTRRKLGTRAEFMRTAKTAGIADSTKFGLCLDTQAYAGRVDSQSLEMTSVGLRATPVLFINGRAILGAPPFEEVARLVRGALLR